jgi:hypothetical protein
MRRITITPLSENERDSHQKKQRQPAESEDTLVFLTLAHNVTVTEYSGDF